MVWHAVARLAVDLRDAVRGLRAGRGTTALAFGLLTLTMAAGTVTYSVVDATALRPLPFPQPDRLVAVGLYSATPGRLDSPSPQDYFAWLPAESLETTGVLLGGPTLEVQRAGRPEELPARRVSASLFRALAIRPHVGRLFGPEHEVDGGSAVVVLGYAAWVRVFGGDPGIVGQLVSFSDATREVIGVLPPDIGYPVGGRLPDAYVPYVPTAFDRDPNAPRRGALMVVARLRPGVTVDQARADLQRFISSTVVKPLHDHVVGPSKGWLVLVLAAVGVVMLVACANVANLLLARAATRAPEMATREALGASRRRLAGGLLIEGLLLALVSGGAATLAAIWGVEVARANLPAGLARTASIAVNERVLLASILAAALVGVVFSTAPAWLTFRGAGADAARAGSHLIGSRQRDRALSAFLVADVAFVCVLLVATGLVVATFVAITRADLGFDRRNVMTMSFQRSVQELPMSDRIAAEVALREQLISRVASLPGVVATAISSGCGPFAGCASRYSVELPGRGDTGQKRLEDRAVSPGYFEALGIQLVRGRLFVDADRFGAEPVILINEIAAQRFFPGQDPIGDRIGFMGDRSVVGVIKNLNSRGPEVDAVPEMYVPLDQRRLGRMLSLETGVARGLLVVRTSGDPRMLEPTVRATIRPLLDREPSATSYLDDEFRSITAVRRFNALVMTVFGLVAAGIGAIGIYGTMAFVVARQVRAIGLRLALGATPGGILRTTLGLALRRVSAGIALGLAGAWAASGAVTAFVFGVSPTEPAVYLGTAGVLAFVGLAAALVPALRAARVDPLVALRQE